MPCGQAAHRRQHDARGRGGRGRWRASEARAREPRTCRYPGQPGASSEPTSRCHASSVSMRVWNDDIAVAAQRAARHAAHGEWPPLAWQSLRSPSLSLAGACSARRARTHARGRQHAVGPTRCRGTGTRGRTFQSRALRRVLSNTMHPTHTGSGRREKCVEWHGFTDVRNRRARPPATLSDLQTINHGPVIRGLRPPRGPSKPSGPVIGTAAPPGPS